MNGADVSDAEARKFYTETFVAFLEWIEKELQGRDGMTDFEKEVFRRAQKILEL